MRPFAYGLLAAAILAAGGAGNLISQKGNQDSPPSIQRGTAFEVVDEEGNVMARLGSNKNGGTLTLFRVGANGESVRFAWVGCSFPGGAEITLRDPKGDGKALLMLSVDGEPMSASMSGVAVNGETVFNIGSRARALPVINTWNTGEAQQSDK